MAKSGKTVSVGEEKALGGQRASTIVQTEERKSAIRRGRIGIHIDTVAVDIINTEVIKKEKVGSDYRTLPEAKCEPLFANNEMTGYNKGGNESEERMRKAKTLSIAQQPSKLVEHEEKTSDDFESSSKLKALTLDLHSGNNEQILERLLKSVNMIKEVLQSNLKLRGQVHELTQRVGQQNTELFHMQCESEDQKEKIAVLSQIADSNNSACLANQLLQVKKKKSMLEQRVHYLETESAKMSSSKPYSTAKESGTDDSEPVRSVVGTLAPVKKAAGRRSKQELCGAYRTVHADLKSCTNKLPSSWAIADNKLGRRNESLASKRVSEVSLRNNRTTYQHQKLIKQIAFDMSDTIDVHIKENLYEEKRKKARNVSVAAGKKSKPNQIYFDNS